MGNEDTSEPEYFGKKLVKLVKLEKTSENEEQERSSNLWIPLKPVSDIIDYQDYQEQDEEDEDDETEVEDHFLRPSALPEAPMLKQEKELKSQSVETAAPLATLYSSSTTIISSSLLLAMALFLSALFH